MNASTLVEAFHDDGLSMQRIHAVLTGTLKRKETDALRLGRALHVRLLEPDVFAAEWQVSKPCFETMKGGPRKGEPCNAPGWQTDGSGRWLCGNHNGDGFVEPENYVDGNEATHIEEIRKRMLVHPQGRHLHKMPGSEVSMVTELQGVRFKLRLDKYGPGNLILPDIKKFAADRLTRHRWETAVDDYHYAEKAAIYVDGVESLTGEKCDFWWIVVEDGPPYHVAFVKATDDTLAIGRHRYQQALEAYKRSIETDEWPGPFPMLIKTWELPRHVIYQHEQMGVISSRKGF